MIYGFALKNNDICIPDEDKFKDEEDFFFKYHREEWTIQDENGDEFAWVIIRERIPLINEDTIKYQMDMTAFGGYTESNSVHQDFNTPKNKVELLEEIATYMKEH